MHSDSVRKDCISESIVQAIIMTVCSLQLDNYTYSSYARHFQIIHFLNIQYYIKTVKLV